MKFFLIVIFVFFQASLMAQPCSLYMESSLDNSYSSDFSLLSSIAEPLPNRSTKVIEFNNINKALLNSVSGEVICF